jgi:hypothetical protein
MNCSHGVARHGVFVEESNLTQTHLSVAAVLVDERTVAAIIENIVRRGYRFIANFRVIAPTELQGFAKPWRSRNMIARLKRGRRRRATAMSHHRRSSNRSTFQLSPQFGSVDEAAGPRTCGSASFLNATATTTSNTRGRSLPIIS